MGPLVAIPGRLNVETYCTILDNNALSMLLQFYYVDACLSKDDNVTCHVASVTTAWYGDNGVQRGWFCCADSGR